MDFREFFLAQQAELPDGELTTKQKNLFVDRIIKWTHDRINDGTSTSSPDPVNVALVVDFDGTITKKHTSGSVKYVETTTVLVAEDFIHLAKFCNNRGIKTYVVTFSSKKLADAETRLTQILHIGGEDLVRRVVPKEVLLEEVIGRHMHSGGKTFHIKKLVEEKKLKMSQMLFIDDDIENCKIAKNLGIPFVLHVTGVGEGLKYSKLQPV